MYVSERETDRQTETERVCVYVCLFVCVCKRERESGGEKERLGERKRDRQTETRYVSGLIFLRDSSKSGRTASQ